jgi:uncharacterized protein
MSKNSQDARAAELMQLLALAPHPEGGAYAEVFRSTTLIDPLDGRPQRAALSSIYFLLVHGGASRWHRVLSDEVWCHLEGAPIELYQLDDSHLELRHTRLGPVQATQRPQCTVAAGQWQAATCEGDYSLVACMVAPGFDFADFSLMDPGSDLAEWWREAHPALAHLI